MKSTTITSAKSKPAKLTPCEIELLESYQLAYTMNVAGIDPVKFFEMHLERLGVPYEILKHNVRAYCFEFTPLTDLYALFESQQKKKKRRGPIPITSSRRRARTSTGMGFRKQMRSSWRKRSRRSYLR